MPLLPLGQVQGAGPETTKGPAQSAMDQFLNIIDPSKARLKIAGLFDSGSSSNKGPQGAVGGQLYVGFNSDAAGASVGSTDWRIKVSLSPTSKIFYNSSDAGILAPLNQTTGGGVIFPYTPNIQVSYNARYSEQKLVHSNYANYFYEGSEVAAITISGEFTVQNIEEGKYLLAALYFFRSATKMFFGTQAGQDAGSPPPILFLDGYGSHYFPHVPCVLTNFQHTMPQDCDYLEVPVTGSQSGKSAPVGNGSTQNTTRLPTLSTISITLQPVYSRKNVHENFNLNKFASGSLINKNTGGFL